MLANSNVLVIDDEPEIRELIGLYLTREGCNFHEAQNAKEALQQIEYINPDLIVLDVFLPDLDGIELCRKIRQTIEVPILFLSCKDSEIDKVIGLSVGGDDYIGKPFSMHELLARIKAHLRRSLLVHKRVEKNIYKSASIVLNADRHECHISNQRLVLTSKEFQLLHFFMRHPQQVFSAEHLMERIWGFNAEIDTKTVMVHIGNLRKKLQGTSKKEAIISTIRGVGYKFNEDVQEVASNISEGF
ncbi:two-component system response regulator VicR [Bacillus fengqiuensis]|nr:two-component system response regulator VicR [Bacillus fengqiuensis]